MVEQATAENSENVSEESKAEETPADEAKA